MWPWEHLALGYLAYSAVSRRVAGRPPKPRETAAVAVGTQFPDLVDKPLGWIFHILPSGVSLAHSALVAGPLTLCLFVLAARHEWARAGLPFAVGYLSHLPADVAYGLLATGSSDASFLLWPLVPQESVIGSRSVLQYVTLLFSRYVSHLGQPYRLSYVLFEVGLLGLTVLAWRRDGYPLLPLPSEPRSESKAE